jgi:hypothetical protein
MKEKYPDDVPEIRPAGQLCLFFLEVVLVDYLPTFGELLEEWFDGIAL